MFIVLLLLLTLLAIGAFYVIFNTTKNTQKKFSANSDRRETKKKIHKKFIPIKHSNKIDGNHPIEEVILVAEQLDKHHAAIENSESKNELDTLFASTKANLLNLDPTEIIQAINKFKPYEQINMMNINAQIHVITTEIIEQINKLTVDEKQIIIISEKVCALALIAESFKNLRIQYEKLLDKDLNDESLDDIIEDSLGIVPTLELGQSECKKLLDFFATFKAFIAITPFLEIQLKEIQSFTQVILEILDTPNGQISHNQTQNLSDIQPQLLDRYRNFFDYFNGLNRGMLEGLQTLKSSALRDIRASQTTLIEIIDNIEEQIEISNYFSSGSGKSENEFNNYFTKIRNLMKSNKSSHSIGIGLIESSQVFFEARAKDADKLINSPYTKQLDQILSRAVRSIERL